MDDPDSRGFEAENAAEGQGAEGGMPSLENGGDPDPEELKTRLAIKTNHIRELYEQIASARLADDEARAFREASEERVEALERERDRLKEKIRNLQEELRQRRLRRESQGRQIERLNRELRRKDGEISRREDLIRRREDQLETLRLETSAEVASKTQALEDAFRRVAGLERDLEDRENRITELNTTIQNLREELEAEYELRRRMAEPANRLRAGIDLFNDSRHRETMNSLSRTLGPPEVHVELEEGEEPCVLLAFTWQGVTWQTYAADPGLAVEEPRVYLKSAGEDLSGVDAKPPNARVGPGGRVLLGL